MKYLILSDKSRVGRELGPGPWCDDVSLRHALLSGDPVGEVAAWLVEDGDVEPLAAEKSAREVSAFTRLHPDWRIVDEESWEGSLVDDAGRSRLARDGVDVDAPGSAVYRRAPGRGGGA